MCFFILSSFTYAIFIIIIVSVAAIGSFPFGSISLVDDFLSHLVSSRSKLPFYLGLQPLGSRFFFGWLGSPLFGGSDLMRFCCHTPFPKKFQKIGYYELEEHLKSLVTNYKRLIKSNVTFMIHHLILFKHNNESLQHRLIVWQKEVAVVALSLFSFNNKNKKQAWCQDQKDKFQ